MKLDKQALLDNKKVGEKIRYAEYELIKILPTFMKSNYPTTILMDNLNKAIEHSKHFCNDTKQLENNLGTNLIDLIEELRK